MSSQIYQYTLWIDKQTRYPNTVTRTTVTRNYKTGSSYYVRMHMQTRHITLIKFDQVRFQYTGCLRTVYTVVNSLRHQFHVITSTLRTVSLFQFFLHFWYTACSLGYCSPVHIGLTMLYSFLSWVVSSRSSVNPQQKQTSSNTSVFPENQHNTG